jgi:hypothetical protein
VAEPLDLARGRPSRPSIDLTSGFTPRHVRGLTPADLPAVVARDDRVFGAHRRVLLEWALDGAGQYAHVIDTDAGAQYCFGRPGRLFDQIGPVAAADDDSARALVSASLRATDGKALVIDAFDRHRGFTSWLKSLGFNASRPLFRMRRSARHSGKDDPDGALHQRAIMGPEFG